MDKIIIGIDQSYQDTGVTVSVNGKVRKVYAIKLSKEKNNSVKRERVRGFLLSLLALIEKKYDTTDTVCIIERIRLKSQGFINIDYIRNMGALNATIIDVMYLHGIKTYSVDTRAWKSAIVGSSKPLSNKYGINPEKYPTIIWCIKNGYKDNIIDYDVGKKKNGVITKNGEKYMYDDNKADSLAISLYGFIPVKKQKLQEEH